MEDMDNLFKRINGMNIQTNENIRNAHSIAVLGFVAIERIGKLQTYNRHDEIQEGLDKYLKEIQELLDFNEGKTKKNPLYRVLSDDT